MASTTASSTSLVLCRLYRSVLRASKPFTSSPEARVLNCLLHRTGVDDQIDDWEEYVKADQGLGKLEDRARDLSVSYGDSKKGANSHRTRNLLFRRLLREVVADDPDGIRRMNFPSLVNTETLKTVIRREFRNGETSISRYFDDITRRQVAFTVLRELNKKMSIYDSTTKLAPESLPQQAAWHVSPLPFSPSKYLRPGAFLLSNPQMTDSFFTRSVICILDCKKEVKDESAAKRMQHSGQTYGIIVNRVSVVAETGKNRTLKEAFDENMFPERLADVFGDSMVKDGGPVHVALQMLYSLSGSEEDKIGGTLIPMIPDDDETENSSTPQFSPDKAIYFQGDVFKAMRAFDKGKLDSDDISFFVGASTWAPGQLESEIAQGFWIPCRGPPEIALTGICEHDTTSKSEIKPLADLWLSMMSACGNDEGRLANLFYHHDWDENLLPCDTFDGEDIDADFF